MTNKTPKNNKATDKGYTENQMFKKLWTEGEIIDLIKKTIGENTTPSLSEGKETKDWREGFNWKLHEVVQNWSAELNSEKDCVITEPALVDLTMKVQSFLSQPFSSLSEGEEIIKQMTLIVGDEWSESERQSGIKRLAKKLLSQTLAEERERMVAIGEELLEIFEGIEISVIDGAYISAVKDYQQRIKNLK